MSTQATRTLTGLDEYVAAYKTGDCQSLKANLLSLSPFTMALTVMAIQDYLQKNGPQMFYEGFRDFIRNTAEREHK